MLSRSVWVSAPDGEVILMLTPVPPFVTEPLFEMWMFPGGGPGGGGKRNSVTGGQYKSVRSAMPLFAFPRHSVRSPIPESCNWYGIAETNIHVHVSGISNGSHPTSTIHCDGTTCYLSCPEADVSVCSYCDCSQWWQSPGSIVSPFSQCAPAVFICRPLVSLRVIRDSPGQFPTGRSPSIPNFSNVAFAGKFLVGWVGWQSPIVFIGRRPSMIVEKSNRKGAISLKSV